MDVSDAPRHFGRRARMGRALSAVRGFTNALGAARDTLLPRATAPIRSLGTARAFTTHAGRGTLPWTTRVDDVLIALKSTAVQNLLHRPPGVFTRGFAAEAGSLKVYKPTSPGQRGRITTTRDHLWKGKPFKALTVGLRKKGGRNNQGRISVWHKGGGHKQLYRVIDMKRRATTAAGTVRRIEYDPNRSTRIALVDFLDDAKGTKPSYVLAAEGMRAGSTIVASTDGGVDIRPGNAMPLKEIPVGTNVHNIELRPGQGGKMVRAAGTSAVLVKKGEDGYATVRLPSGEQRLVLLACMATIGTLSNAQHANRVLGKAGAVRWLGVRPTTRGVAMNPIDHPHGGGEGRTSGGRPSVTPWGVHTKGHRTRNSKRTDNMRVARRPTGKGKKR